MLLCLQYSRLGLWCEGVESRSRGRLGGFCSNIVSIKLQLMVRVLHLPAELVFISGQEV
jgi:hypothetical protein